MKQKTEAEKISNSIKEKDSRSYLANSSHLDALYNSHVSSFYSQYAITIIVGHGIVAFVLVIAFLALWDLSNPKGGVFNVEIPKEWKED